MREAFAPIFVSKNISIYEILTIEISTKQPGPELIHTAWVQQTGNFILNGLMYRRSLEISTRQEFI